MKKGISLKIMFWKLECKSLVTVGIWKGEQNMAFQQCTGVFNQ